MDSKNLIEQLSKPLDIKDVDFRIQSINKGGYATILAYKDARVDMNRLDAVCGTNWQDKYELIDNQLFCSIGIKIGDDWVWRQDVGEESFTEKTKGRASDAFKRAGFRWGIGRELYDYPLIQIKLIENTSNPKYGEYYIEGDKVKQGYGLKLREWNWEAEFGKDGLELKAFDEKGTLRFDFPNGKQTTQTSYPETQKPQPKAKSETPKELPWLNVMDKNKNLTKDWLNVVKKINNGSIPNIDFIKKYYRLSEATEIKVNELFNYQTT
ncbi:MAG TPA: Rad52/Rad22 family DNA repair protein [Flavobacterium sp.]|nr:Rad52/Rad22 family DNA repair protein [Flavobacterium sp.]